MYCIKNITVILEMLYTGSAVGTGLGYRHASLTVM